MMLFATAPVVVVIIVVGVIIAIIYLVMLGHDVIKKIYVWYKGASCGLETYWLMKDQCTGPCPPGTGVCVATLTKPYGWPITLGVQDAGCACKPAGSGVAGGTGGPTGASKAIQKAKEALKPAERHTEDTDKAIDEAGR